MKQIYFKLLVVAVLVTASLLPIMSQNNYYDKHVIVAVDQTPDVQNHINMPLINAWLQNILTGRTISKGELSPTSIPLQGFAFNTTTDCIELFAFGIEGASSFSTYYWWHPDNQYGRIKRNQNEFTNDELYKEITDALLRPEEMYKPLSDFPEYYREIISPTLSAQNRKYQVISDVSGVTLSYYVYPFILNKISNNLPACEYYLVLITNFKSGSIDGVNSEDERLFGEWITDGYKQEYIKSRNAKLESDFLKVPIAKYVPRENADKNCPIIVISKLLPKQSVISSTSSADIESTIELKQKTLNGSTYELSEIAVKNDSANVDCVDLKVLLNSQEKDAVVYQKGDWDYHKKSFIFPRQEITFDNLKEGDTVTFSFVFYPQIKSKLPLVTVAEQYHVMQKSDFVAPPTTWEDFRAYVILFILFVFGMLGLRMVYAWRGRSREIEIKDFRIWPISNSHYMQVKDKHVINYDCWYWRGKSDDHRAIQISGVVAPKKKIFAKSYDYVVEYSLADSDTNEDFSFRPAGKDGEAHVRELNRFYEVSFASDGSFSFNAEAFVDFAELERQNRREPNFDIDNILSLTVTMKVTTIKGRKVINTETLPPQKYSFIVRPALERPDLWVSFDLGTTGSCMAFGQAGNLAQRNNIYMVNNKTRNIVDEKSLIPIFPSKIIIPDNSRLFDSRFNVSEAIEPKDYVFGNRAEQHWNESRNRFQSIKKLLGYTTLQKIYRAGADAYISGQDLAFLLAKGMFDRFEIDINENHSEQVRNIFLDEKGHLLAERAIVAVPNNYMLNKVQEMVDSVKRLNKFKEVHYLYESEGVFMTYLSQELQNLHGKQNKLFVVYDMGGATINITAFTIQCVMRKQNISRIIVNTEAKVGYAVGGDDIDFAIIQFLYAIPSVRECFDSKSKIQEHQRLHKNKLIEIVRKIKLDWIDKNNNSVKSGNVTTDLQTFWGHIQSQFMEIGIKLAEMTEKDSKKISEEIKKRSIFKKYVQNYVEDCVKELMSSLDVSSTNEIELILSGRSILYPGVTETATRTLSNYTPDLNVWEGFTKTDGTFADKAIKTAVARGACWYAMNGGQIELKHDIISFSFGYLDTIGGRLKFVPLIDKLNPNQSHYDEAGKFVSKAVEPIDPNLNTIDFVQMLGSNYDEIYDGETKIQHKINFLDRIDQATITGQVETIQVTIDRENNFDYSVKINGIDEPITIESNPHSRFGSAVVQTEITDENSAAYTFAAVNVCNE